MKTSRTGMIETAMRRLEKRSGVPLRLQCVAIAGGRCGHAHTDTPAANAAITMPNQRLRIALSPEASHEVAHDLLKHGRIQPVADELPLTLGGHEVRRLEHPQVVRDRGESHRELLRDLASRPVFLGQQLENATPRGVGQRPKQGVIHWARYLYNRLNMSSKVDSIGPHHKRASHVGEGPRPLDSGAPRARRI